MAAQIREHPFTTNVDAGSKSPPSAAAGHTFGRAEVPRQTRKEAEKRLCEAQAASSRPPDS